MTRFSSPSASKVLLLAALASSAAMGNPAIRDADVDPAVADSAVSADAETSTSTYNDIFSAWSETFTNERYNITIQHLTPSGDIKCFEAAAADAYGIVYLALSDCDPTRNQTFQRISRPDFFGEGGGVFLKQLDGADPAHEVCWEVISVLHEDGPATGFYVELRTCDPDNLAQHWQLHGNNNDAVWFFAPNFSKAAGQGDQCINVNMDANCVEGGANGDCMPIIEMANCTMFDTVANPQQVLKEADV